MTNKQNIDQKTRLCDLLVQLPPSTSERIAQAAGLEDSAQVVDASLLQVTLPSIPGLVERLQAGIDVADIGCGSGHAINVMAQAFPKSRFVGYDLITAFDAIHDQARPAQVLASIARALRPHGQPLNQLDRFRWQAAKAEYAFIVQTTRIGTTMRVVCTIALSQGYRYLP